MQDSREASQVQNLFAPRAMSMDVLVRSDSTDSATVSRAAAPMRGMAGQFVYGCLRGACVLNV